MSEGEKTKMSTTLGTYITLLGYSWGMSDLWRFPFLAYRNGGGAFLIPFVLTILLCGIPLYFLEYGIGKFSGKGPFRVWDVCPIFRGIGVAIFLAYTSYIIASTIFRVWLCEFLMYTFNDPLPWTVCTNSWNTPTCRGDSNIRSNSSGYNITSDVNLTYYVSNITTDFSVTDVNTTITAEEEFWQNGVLELSSGLTDLFPIQWRYMLISFIWRTAVLVIILFGIRAIEKVMYVTTAVPIVASVAIFVRSLMLPGATDGLYHFFYPELSRLSDIKIWLEAFVMGFYTLSFGWGCVVLLGSHSKFKESSVKAAVIIPILDAAMAIFQGMVCFSVLGNMAHVHQTDITEIIHANLSTGIVAYISALATLPFPQLWAFLFFVSFILSGLDSQIIPVEMSIQIIGAVFPKLFPRYRLHTVFVFSAALFILALPTCTGGGSYIFLLVDWYAGAWSGLDRFNDDMKMMTGTSIPCNIRLGIAILSPLFVLTIFIMACAGYVPPKYGSYVYPPWARILGWLLVTFIMMPIVLTVVKTVWMENGHLYQRIRSSIKPCQNWGPSDDNSRSVYHNIRTKYQSRTFKDLFLYNILGRCNYSENVQNGTSKEMNRLWTEN